MFFSPSQGAAHHRPATDRVGGLSAVCDRQRLAAIYQHHSPPIAFVRTAGQGIDLARPFATGYDSEAVNRQLIVPCHNGPQFGCNRTQNCSSDLVPGYALPPLSPPQTPTRMAVSDPSFPRVEVRPLDIQQIVTDVCKNELAEHPQVQVGTMLLVCRYNMDSACFTKTSRGCSGTCILTDGKICNGNEAGDGNDTEAQRWQP